MDYRWRSAAADVVDFYAAFPQAVKGIELTCKQCGPSVRWHVWPTEPGEAVNFVEWAEHHAHQHVEVEAFDKAHAHQHAPLRQNLLSGAEQIVVERWRQVYVLGWTAEHDAQQPDDLLVETALRYITRSNEETGRARIEALVKAGAMLAATVDRLQA